MLTATDQFMAIEEFLQWQERLEPIVDEIKEYISEKNHYIDRFLRPYSI